MTVITWFRVLLSAAGAGWLTHLLGMPDPVAVGAALLVAVAQWRAPPKPPAPRAAPEVGPGLDLGRIAFVPPTLTSLWPHEPFHLRLDELLRHVAVVGATGSGKTTTLGRFIDAALLAGWPVLVVDAKGGRLAEVSRLLGERHSLPVRLWLPGVLDSWTYDVCAGDPVAVANRLVGAFEHGREGQVFKNLSQAIVPLVLQAMHQSGVVATLDSLRFTLDRAHLVGLARRVEDPALKAELMALREDELHRATLSGLVGRLRALRFGLFGPWLLPSDRTLDLAQSLVEPGLTYLGLPATAASEDVALVGRVLVQHLKQVAYEALWSGDRHPALIVFDEFVSLREAQQLVDLLLQAREARLAVVVSTQHVPREHPLRHSVLSAGTLIVHQVGSPDDADVLARALGTRTAPEIAQQLPIARDGTVSRRLVRLRHSFLIPPDDLARLPVGQAAVSVRFGEQRLAIVQVDPLEIT
jgi:hypothetical protein